MSKLATMRHISRAEQYADITIKLRLLAFPGAAWPAGLAMLWRVPPELLGHAFLGIDLAIDRFLTDMQFRIFIDHPVADLLGCPALLDPRDHSFAQLRMPNQFALLGTVLLRALVRHHSSILRRSCELSCV